MAEHRVKGLTHIGTDRQLFVDDYMVESTKHAAFTSRVEAPLAL